MQMVILTMWLLTQWLSALPLVPYSALDILQFGQNLQAEAVSLTSDPAASVHVIPQGQHQPQNTFHPRALQECLKTTANTASIWSTHTHKRSQRPRNPCNCSSYPADSGDGVELALNRQHPFNEGRPEDDAVSSARKVWDLRQLVQEPGVEQQKIIK